MGDVTDIRPKPRHWPKMLAVVWDDEDVQLRHAPGVGDIEMIEMLGMVRDKLIMSLSDQE